MALMVLDAGDVKRLKQERAASGADRFDEVWEGVYMMAPLANNEHQYLATMFCRICLDVVQVPDQGMVYVGVNVSDRERDWRKNYRCPDVAVFLHGTPAKDCRTHWYGGPDLAIEIVSPKDRTRDKLEFYAQVGVRELLVVDRRPWRLELYRLQDKTLQLAGMSTPKRTLKLESQVLQVTFQLVAARPRPRIEAASNDGTLRWSF